MIAPKPLEAFQQLSTAVSGHGSVAWLIHGQMPKQIGDIAVLVIKEGIKRWNTCTILRTEPTINRVRLWDLPLTDTGLFDALAIAHSIDAGEHVFKPDHEFEILA